MFTLLGYMGLYLLLGILFLFLIQREIGHGPASGLPASDSHYTSVVAASRES
jgi:cytochrome bd-type quinol oxidase subunit 1